MTQKRDLPSDDRRAAEHASGLREPRSAFTKRPISHDEAREVAQRLINSHFRREPCARVGIPARPDYDDDLLISAYIEQQAALSTRPTPAAGERERIARCLLGAKIETWQHCLDAADRVLAVHPAAGEWQRGMEDAAKIAEADGDIGELIASEIRKRGASSPSPGEGREERAERKDFKIAQSRRGGPAGATLDELAEKYGLGREWPSEEQIEDFWQTDGCSIQTKVTAGDWHGVRNSISRFLRRALAAAPSAPASEPSEDEIAELIREHIAFESHYKGVVLTNAAAHMVCHRFRSAPASEAKMREALEDLMRLYESKWSDEPPELVRARAALSPTEDRSK